jgi:hypothetical protein
MANAVEIIQTWESDYVAELFLEPAIDTEDGLFAGGYTVDAFVNKSKTFYVNSELKYITKKKDTCGFTPFGTSDLTEVTLVTQPMAVNLEQCAAEFFDTVFKRTLKKGTGVYNLEGDVIMNAVVANAQRAIKNDAFVLAWFGNTTIASTAANAFLNPFNGWFKLFEGDADVKKYSIGSTGDFALEALRAISDAVETSIIEQDDASVYLVTRSVYQNLLKTYESLGTDVGLTRLNDGHDLMFRGVPVIRQNIWDKSISDLSLGSSKRIFYGPLANLVVGTDIANPANDAMLFLDQLQEKTYFKTNFDLGVNYTFAQKCAYARG